jgi:hypothetical protein
LPSIEAEVEKSGFAAKHTAFLKGLQQKYPNLSVIDGRQANYDKDVYMDGNHLGRPGAYVASLEVSKLMARRLKGHSAHSAWLTLPEYQERAVDVAVQDAYHTTPIERRDSPTVRR